MDSKSLITRGHVVGGGLRSPDRNWFVLSVPKNASSYTTNILLRNGWEHWNLSLQDFGEVVVPLRDPVERWVSGMATYCCSYLLGENYGSEHFVADYNELTQRLLVDSTMFDDHTTPQSVFEGFVPNQYPKHYIWVNRDRFITDLSTVTGISIVEYDGVYDNHRDSNIDTSRISDFLKSRLDHGLVSKIKMLYNNDYRLIESVRIHGR